MVQNLKFSINGRNIGVTSDHLSLVKDLNKLFHWPEYNNPAHFYQKVGSMNLQEMLDEIIADTTDKTAKR
jgi:hypothetical protein